MRLVLVSVPTVLFWAAAIRRWRTVREGWSQASLWVTLVTLAVALTIDLPPIVTVLDGVVPNVMHMVKHSLVLLAAAGVHETLRGLAMPSPAAREGWPRRAAPTAVAVSLLMAAFVAAPVRDLPVDSLTHADVRHPALLFYFAVYMGVLGWALAAIAVHQLQFVRSSAPSPLTTGMGLIGMGAVAGLGYLVSKAVYVLSRALGVQEGPWTQDTGIVEAALLALSGTLLVLGIFWPSRRWGSHLGALRTWRALRRLRPMWAALAAATPGIVFGTPAERDRLRPVADLDARLYARVIEVRDGLLALRGWLPPGAGDIARQEADAAGVPASRRDVLAQAVRLGVACRTKQEASSEGRAPGAGEDPVPTGPARWLDGTSPDATPNGLDTADDLQQLERIAAWWTLAERLVDHTRLDMTGPTSRRSAR